MMIELNEGTRRLVLKALAHLACERPDLESSLDEIASQMDDMSEDRPALMSRYKDERRDALRLDTARGLTPEQRRSET